MTVFLLEGLVGGDSTSMGVASLLPQATQSLYDQSESCTHIFGTKSDKVRVGVCLLQGHRVKPCLQSFL